MTWTPTVCRPGTMAKLITLMVLLSALMGAVRADGCRAVNTSVGGNFTCSTLQDGSARCWGDSSFGELGRPNITTTSDPNGPPLDFGAGRTVLQLATYNSSSCALLDDHTMSCWGNNDVGQLGLGDTLYRTQPTQVQLGTGNQTVQLISTGSIADHSCAVVAGEGVFCWGSTVELGGTPWLGQVDTTDTAVSLPSKVDLGSVGGSALTVIDMCAGPFHTCVLTAQLGLKCWGVTMDGELGLGGIKDTTGLTGLSLPSVNLGTGRSAVQISCGSVHTCAVLDNGALKCFGNNDNGQLGYGDTNSRGAATADMGDALTPVDLGKKRTVKQVAAGYTHTCVLLDNGQVTCWGGNDAGQLGHSCNSLTWGDSLGQMGDSLPAVDLGPNRTAVSVSAGFTHSCAVLNNGSVKCWGDNTKGALGVFGNSSTLSGQLCSPDQTVDLGSSCTANIASPGINNASNVAVPPSKPGTITPTPAPTPPSTTTPAPTPTSSPTRTPNASSSQSAPAAINAAEASGPSASHSAPAGTIAGAVIAAVVVAALGGFAVWWWRNRRQGNSAGGTIDMGAGSKQPPAQVLAVATDEFVAPTTAASGVHSTADVKVDVETGTKTSVPGTNYSRTASIADAKMNTEGGFGALIRTVIAKTVGSCTTNSHTASTAAPSATVHSDAKGTPPLTSTGSHKTDARDTNTSRAASAAAPSSGIIREGSVDDMLIPWSHITLGSLLGEGGFGKVYKGKWQMETVAVKIMNMHKTGTVASEGLNKEALIMSGLRHPCIARVFGVVDEDPHHALVMQYYPKGTLAKYLTTSGYAVLELPAKLHIALQVASGMRFMHERAVPVLHGDLKATNILLTGPGRRVVIADFGLSQAMLMGQEAAVASGALTYSISPPEVLNDPLAPRTRAADVYAFAILLLEIYTGQPCFRGLRVADIRRLVTGGHRPKLPPGMPKCITDVIEACWAQDPASRPSFTVVVEQLAAAAAELQVDCFTNGTVTVVGTQTTTDW